MADAIKDAMAMTHFKFNSNVKRFLADLLEDPVNSEPNVIFKHNGIDKNKLLKGLEARKVIIKKMNIDDHDSDGKPHKAMMIVKYSVPKERFQEKLDAVFDDLFPDFPTKIDETEIRFGGDSSYPKKSCAGYIYCQDENGAWYILTGKRGMTSPTGAGQFNPPMGMVEYNEDVKLCVSRECFEETGISIPPNKFNFGGTENWGQSNENIGYSFYCYLDGTINDYRIGNGDGENDKFIWLPIDRIPEYDWAFTTGEKAKELAPKDIHRDKIEEEGGAGGGAASCSGVDGNGFGSGEFIQPLFGVQKKKKYSQAINEGVTGVDDENRGAAGYIYCQDADGQWCILAGKRITNDDSNSLMNPPMGHLHVDEDPHDGVARECREETDINIPKNRFIQKDVEEYAKGHFTYHFVAVLYGDTTEQHEPGEGDGENEHFKWIPVSEIGNYKWAFGTQKKAMKYIPSATNQQNPELQNGPTQQLQQAVAESVNEDGGGATSTCGGGLPGEFDVPFGGDKETLDRTPGNTCGMHNRVGNSNLIKKKDNGRRDSLNESQESKSIDAAKRLFMQRTGKSAEEADKFVRIDLRNDMPVLRDKNGGKFILGVTRMFLDRQLTDASTILNLNRTLKLLTQGHFSEYDRNLNGMSAQDVISRFATAMKRMDDSEREELGGMVFNENSDYQIVRIDNFEQASRYGRYTSWCVTDSEKMFDSYTSDGIGQFYFCLRNGFKKEPEKMGKGCPLDSYGLSMVAVSVDENGRLNTCTCRWNHDNGGNDSIMDVKQISQLIGRNFFDVFKPNGKWQELVGNAMDRLRNGESPVDVFDFCTNFHKGMAKVALKNSWNWVRADNGQLLSDRWYDFCGNFREGMAVVRLQRKWNWVRADNGQLLSDQWYDNCGGFSDGLAAVQLNGKYNWVRADNGQLLSDQWFDSCGAFVNGLADVKLNNRYNWVRADNGQLLSDQWFAWRDDFSEGLARVGLNGKWNWVRADNGQLFSGQWFDSCGDFSDGLAEVKVNGKWNWVRADNGQMFSDQWYDGCGDFHEGLARVGLNGKWNWVRADNGQLLSDQWFDFCSDFGRGLANVELNGGMYCMRRDGVLCDYNTGQPITQE